MQKTIKNLSQAFIGESQARNRYTIYAKIAKEEGYEQIAAIFKETANQEKEHASWLFHFINDLKKEADDASKYEEIIVETGVSTILGTTAENLKAAIQGENYEYSTMYPDFAATAREEGLNNIATRLLLIAKAEIHHEERYKKLLAEVTRDSVFKKENETDWVCRKCGYTHTGKNAPAKCPNCDYPQAYFQVKCETY